MRGEKIASSAACFKARLSSCPRQQLSHVTTPASRVQLAQPATLDNAPVFPRASSTWLNGCQPARPQSDTWTRLTRRQDGQLDHASRQTGPCRGPDFASLRATLTCIHASEQSPNQPRHSPDAPLDETPSLPTAESALSESNHLTVANPHLLYPTLAVGPPRGSCRTVCREGDVPGEKIRR